MDAVRGLAVVLRASMALGLFVCVMLPGHAAAAQDGEDGGRTAVTRPNGELPNRPAAAGGGEKVTVTTDVMRATFDSVGGSLVRVELLGQQEVGDGKRSAVLLDQSAQRQYVAQSGVLVDSREMAGPNHLTQMAVAPGARELSQGQDRLQLRFESPDAVGSGIKLVKTFSFARGEYAIGVKHEIVNQSSLPVSSGVPAAGARRCDTGRRVASVFDLHRACAVHREQQVPEDRLQEHRQGSQRERHQGGQRLGGDGAALFRVSLAAGDER